jgi:hypothetical protein
MYAPGVCTGSGLAPGGSGRSSSLSAVRSTKVGVAWAGPEAETDRGCGEDLVCLESEGGKGGGGDNNQYTLPGGHDHSEVAGSC